MGITGSLPRPTSQLAVCYVGGYQSEMPLYAAGVEVAEKLAVLRRQIDENVADQTDYDVLRIDQYGVPMSNSTSQARRIGAIRRLRAGPAGGYTRPASLRYPERRGWACYRRMHSNMGRPNSGPEDVHAL